MTGKRLDSPAPPLVVDRATNALLANGDAMLVGLGFPTGGCWQITGRYEEEELTFVVWVPSDTVAVSKAGIVYVVGDVHKPMNVVMENSGHITVLQALATAEGASDC